MLRGILVVVVLAVGCARGSDASRDMAPDLASAGAEGGGSDAGATTGGDDGPDGSGSGGDSGADGTGTSGGAVPPNLDDTTGGSGGAETTGTTGGPGGDPGCPPGFLLAFEITDDVGDQMPNECYWLGGAILGPGNRIAIEWWGADGTHFPATTWNFAAYDALRDQFDACLGGATTVTSEDGQHAATFIPSDSMVIVTPAGQTPLSGAAHYELWLANEYMQNDEILGVDFPSWAEAWDARFTSGDRVRVCYEP